MIIYMHKNSMDVALLISDMSSNDEQTKLTGQYINLGYTGNPWLIEYHPVNLTIPTQIFKSDWVDISDRYRTPRTKSGIPGAEHR